MKNRVSLSGEEEILHPIFFIIKRKEIKTMEDLLTMYGDELFDVEDDYCGDFYKENEEELSDEELFAIIYTIFECSGK